MKPLPEIIGDEVRKQGVISFARFMELALYCPVCGFYEKEADTIGRRGDFYTSVSVGSLFGELLAFQFSEWLVQLRTPPTQDTAGRHCLKIIEAGAHDGRLAEDILTWLREHRRSLFDEIEYWILEPSVRRRSWQQARLEKFRPQVRWADSLDMLVASKESADKECETRSAARGLHGVIFANELLDAFPIHRLGWDSARRNWFEWGVAMEGGRFVWRKLPEPTLPDSQIVRRFPPLEMVEALPEGFAIEVAPAAEAWWHQAAGILQRGKLATIDYGSMSEEHFEPGRNQGTLRAYRHHQVSNDVLADPGEQDLTAHVNFTALRQAGESAGLKSESFETQAKFLTSIAGRIWKAPATFGEWTPARTRQFQTLTHPEHLGRAFRVLVQAR